MTRPEASLMRDLAALLARAYLRFQRPPSPHDRLDRLPHDWLSPDLRRLDVLAEESVHVKHTGRENRP